jgi:hypothetical protein
MLGFTTLPIICIYKNDNFINYPNLGYDISKQIRVMVLIDTVWLFLRNDAG